MLRPIRNLIRRKRPLLLWAELLRSVSSTSLLWVEQHLVVLRVESTDFVWRMTWSSASEVHVLHHSVLSVYSSIHICDSIVRLDRRKRLSTWIRSSRVGMDVDLTYYAHWPTDWQGLSYLRHRWIVKHIILTTCRRNTRTPIAYMSGTLRPTRPPVDPTLSRIRSKSEQEIRNHVFLSQI